MIRLGVFSLLTALWFVTACVDEPHDSTPAVAERFQRAFDAGASCAELFEIRNTADPKDPARPIFNDMLRGVGCYMDTSKRVAPRSGSTDVYSINYKSGYMVCSADSLETYQQAGTNDPGSAARWLAGGQKGEAYQGTYDGCLAGLLGEPSRFPEPASEDPVVEAPYSEIEAVLEGAGLTICDFIEYRRNRGYGYAGSRSYDVAVGECPSDRPEVEGNPSYGSVDVEAYESVAARDKGAAIHREEIINEQYFSGAAWAYENLLIEFGHYLHRDFAARVKDALAGLPGAELLYFRFQ